MQVSRQLSILDVNVTPSNYCLSGLLEFIQNILSSGVLDSWKVNGRLFGIVNMSPEMLGNARLGNTELYIINSYIAYSI